MSEFPPLSEFLSLSGDIAYAWDVMADHIDWFGGWDRVFGAGQTPPFHAASLHEAVHPDDRHLIFGTEQKKIDRHYRLIGANGLVVWVHERGRTDIKDGQPLLQRGILRVIEAPERTALTEPLKRYSPELLEMNERIKHAFRHEGFKLAFQPIVDAKSGDVLCYEALVRMFDDAGKPISAALFVPAIEDLGLAFELDRLVLDLAIKEMEKDPTLSLAINVSGLTAVHEEWPDYMRQQLQSRRSVAERLIIEITETAAIVDVSKTHRFVTDLRELGGRVSLDDFGAGFTSIRHLRSLSLSIMKIDKELLNAILTSAEQQHLVLVLVELAHGLGLKIVAEGVETAEVADWLRSARIDMLQGYYFGKPVFERAGSLIKKVEKAPTPLAQVQAAVRSESNMDALAKLRAAIR